MSGAKGYRGADGNYFYSSVATYRCPNAPYGDERARTSGWSPDPRITGALERFGVDAARLFRAAHPNTTPRDASDPSICGACGAVLEKVGYQAWRESMVGGGMFAQRDQRQIFGLKREAIQWAREQAVLSRNA